MIKLCADYLRLILFCSGLLMGIQIPAVVDQYEKRIDAHLSEAVGIFAGFQQTADRYFSGSVADLIQHYERSDDPVFQHDAANIRFISQRVLLLQSEVQALQKWALHRAIHVLFASDRKIIQETMAQYSYMILINPQALVWGVMSGILLAILLDALINFMRLMWLRFAAKSHNHNET
jgi:hypothetical protein